MSLPRFAYLAPSTLSEAFSLADSDSLFVAGGTDLFVRMKDRIVSPKRVIGLAQITELQGVYVSEQGGLRIGAATTLVDLADDASAKAGWQCLAPVIHLTSSPLLRNTGTIGGNLCQESRCTYYNQPPIFRKRWQPCFKLGGDRCHVVKASKVCHAVYSGDLAGPLMALKATATMASPRGSRTVQMEDFFTGSGIQPTIMGSDEILTEIVIPKLPRYAGFSYQKLRLRDTIDFPLLGISLFLVFDPSEEGGLCRDARLVLSAAGPSPMMIHEVVPVLRGKVVIEKMAEDIGSIMKKVAKPVANTASSPRYRREMIPVLVRRALQSVLNQVFTKAERTP